MIKHLTFNKILREELALAKLLGLAESAETPREVRVDRVKPGDEMLVNGSYQAVTRVKRKFDTVSVWLDNTDPFEPLQYELDARVSVIRGKKDVTQASRSNSLTLIGDPVIGQAGRRRDVTKQRMGRFGMI